MRAPLIIGGGPAGAAAAATIAAAGQPVRLLERNGAPADKVCGDFLSGGALAALRSLGFDPLTAGGVAVRTIRLIHRATAAEAPLPFPAASLARRQLDEALLQIAARNGATILRGRTVRGLYPDANGFRVRTTIAAAGTAVHLAAGTPGADEATACPGAGTPGADASTVCPRATTSGPSTVEPDTVPSSPEDSTAGTVLLATGKHDLRGHARPPRADGLIGLKMYYILAPDARAAIHETTELHLLRDGYAGLQPVGQGRAVLCALLAAARYRRVRCDWPALLEDLARDAPLLARRLAGAIPCLAQPLAIAGTPYGHLQHPARAAPSGLFRLGDQACVVPSLAGDGVAIALHSGLAAASVCLRQGDAAAYYAALARQSAGPLRFAGLLHAALRLPRLQQLVVAGCRAWPGALRAAAALTRVAPQA